MNKLMQVILFFVFSLVCSNDFISSLYGQAGTEKSEKNSSEFRTQLSEALQVYFELEKAIFEGDTKIAAEKANLVSKTVYDVDSESLEEERLADWQEVNQELKTAAEKLSSEEGIAEQRNAFLAVSNAFIDITRSFGPFNVDAFLYHCPMALDSGGHWLSASKDVSNPYLGEAMPTCGTLVESFSAKN